MYWPFAYCGFMGKLSGWTTITQTVDPWIDSPPDFGVHLVYEIQFRNAQVSTATNLQMFMNGDLTTGNYHIQRYVGADNAAAATEATAANGAQIAGASNVSGYYSAVNLIFPFFRVPNRQRVGVGHYTIELAALNQQTAIYVQKRQGASVTGTLVDKLTTVQFSNALANATDGTLRRAVVLPC